MNNTPIRCQCGLNNKITCKNCSTIKMVIYLKPSNPHYAKKITWYNHLSKNRKPPNRIIPPMVRRASEKYNSSIQLIIFYENTNKTEIYRTNLKPKKDD